MRRFQHVGDKISYARLSALDDRELDDLREELRRRDLQAVDTGNGYTIGWRYAADGSELREPEDKLFGPQPITSFRARRHADE